MRAWWTDEVIEKQGGVSTWTNCTVNIKLKHPDFLDNGANYEIFFVFKKVYVFKQHNYWSSVEISVIMLIYTSTNSDLNRQTGKKKHFLPSPPTFNLLWNAKGYSCKIKADLEIVRISEKIVALWIFNNDFFWLLHLDKIEENFYLHRKDSVAL